MDIDLAVQKTGSPRKRIITALDYLEQKGDLELKVSGPRLGFRRITGQDIDIPALKEKLVQRFVTREKNDIMRLQQVVEMVNHAGCKTRFLMSYFGEDIKKECGHCSFCLNGENAPIERDTAGAERLDSALLKKLQALREHYTEALQTPRQMTRFLCGISSPLLIKNKLGKHELFGTCEEVPFEQVMSWLMDQEKG